MKVALWIGGIVLSLAVAYFGLHLLATADLVTSRYSTLNDARADRLFERGWLPDILPASAREIRTTNDLDINTSEGEFGFAPDDYQTFASRLSPYSPGAARSKDRDRYVRKMEGRGYQSGTLSEEGSTWLFVCERERGYCEYTMWMDRQ